VLHGPVVFLPTLDAVAVVVEVLNDHTPSRTGLSGWARCGAELRDELVGPAPPGAGPKVLQMGCCPHWAVGGKGRSCGYGSGGASLC
jgi:hypothetical protein